MRMNMLIVPSPLGWALKVPNGVELGFLSRERGWTREMVGDIEDLLRKVHSDGFGEGMKRGSEVDYDEGYGEGYTDGRAEGGQ
jgi:hypothetical protein